MNLSVGTLGLAQGVELRGGLEGGWEEVLHEGSTGFLASLVRVYAPRLAELLAARRDRQARFDAGELPGFLPETAPVRAAEWRVAPLPRELLDRRVEITGPVDRKMVINALNSGANVYMADFEDSTSPTWANVVEGQLNVRDAVRGTIRHEQGDRVYALCERPAVLVVRPRGLHLPEAHLLVDGQPAPAALFDAGLYLFHNAAALLAKGTAPYLYLPKLESHLEARWWNEVLTWAERALSIPVGSIKATVLIETLPAAFEMDEILWELREHAAGLNCGRWDYIFSRIKTLRAHADHVTPDRARITMTQPAMRAYTQLLVRTCHRRGAFAMGGMAAQIPIKDDPAANAAALANVRADKLREAADGHDGTWVAHPALVAVAREAFDAVGPNQLHVSRDDVRVTAADLLAPPQGTRTIEGLRTNVRVGVQYLAAWLRGSGCVPLYNLMEDAATAEISRAQLWQWIRHGAALEDGRVVTRELVGAVLDEELAALRRAPGDRLDEARELFEAVATAEELPDFLTLPAYEHIA